MRRTTDTAVRLKKNDITIVHSKWRLIPPKSVSVWR